VPGAFLDRVEAGQVGDLCVVGKLVDLAELAELARNRVGT
jgi:hypothetical protein